jgi:hypothetical protein
MTPSECSLFVCVGALLVLGIVLLSILSIAQVAVRKARLEYLKDRTLILVKAAERMYGDGNGEAKLRYVKTQAEKCRLVGVGISMIEAAVFDMKAGKQEGA